MDFKASLRPAYYWARGKWYGGRRRHCPVCGGSFRRFLPKGDPPRAEAMCPRCLSLERHRLLWLFLERSPLPGKAAVLHFAPEPALRARLSRLPGIRYATADISPGRAASAMDIRNLGLRPESFDLVICCHVLEHVADDRAALRELLRVLRPGGAAVLQVPLRDGPTDEDPAADPEERWRRFGQEDHVRLYGSDFPERVASAGFRVDRVEFGGERGARESERCGLPPPGDPDGLIFLGRKPE